MIRLLAKTSNLDEIADKLRMSPNSINAKKRIIMHKANAKDLDDLFRFAVAHGIVARD